MDKTITIEIKTKAIKNTLCASKMRGEGNMPLNNVNVEVFGDQVADL